MLRSKDFLMITLGKGGTGKTRMATVLDGYCRDREIPFVGLDADLSNASYHRFSDKAIPIDVGTAEVDRWIEQQVLQHLIHGHGTSMVIDTGAGTERNLREWIAENDVISILERRHTEVLLFHVFDPSIDSITPLLESIDVLPTARHVVVFNHGLTRGMPATKAFAAIEKEREFIAHGAHRPRLVLPPLVDMSTIDRTDYPIYEDQAPGSELARNPMFVTRLRKWRKEIYAQLDTLLENDFIDAEKYDNPF